MIREEWVDAYKDRIPKGQYSVKVISGEEHGLIIYLYGMGDNAYTVILDFGIVNAFQMIEEGTLLNVPDYTEESDSQILIREQGYPSVLYKVEGSLFEEYIRSSMGASLYDINKTCQYVVITENYFLSVVCPTEPEITIEVQNGSAM